MLKSLVASSTAAVSYASFYFLQEGPSVINSIQFYTLLDSGEDSTIYNSVRMFLSCTTILDFCSTKYLGGHSDVLGGVLTARSMDLWTKLNKMRMAVGNTMVNSLHYGTKFQKIIFFPSKNLCINVISVLMKLNNSNWKQ